MPENSTDVARLRRSIEWGVRNALHPAELLLMAESLVDAAEPGSPSWVYAQRQLAELLVEPDPWRATITARLVAKHTPEDDGAYAVQGLALTLLGHYRVAARAYRQALAIAPNNPWYAHNLGHLLDVALARPLDALPLLRRAHQLEPHAEIASSLAHALGRTGHVAEATTLLKRSFKGEPPSDDQQALLSWLESGAPAVPGRRSTRRDREIRR
jgi:tetratricopeptide (TPR) repeat protein